MPFLVERDWSIAASLEDCKKLLAGPMGQSGVKHWKTTAAAYLVAKAPLLQAIEPTTGRLELATDDIYKRSAQDVFRDDCTRQMVAINHAYETQTPLSAIECEKIEKQKSIIKVLLSWFPYAWLESGTTSETAHFQLNIRAPKTLIRKGTRCTRAVAKIFREYGWTDDEASAIADRLFATAANERRFAAITLSCNPLDLLSVSNFCTYTSCHKMGGEHQGGPLQYLMDSQSAVAYFYRDGMADNTYGRVTGLLPQKLWRQMVYFDPTHKSVVFARHYPGVVLDSEKYKALRSLAMEALVRMLALGGANWAHAEWGDKKPGSKILNKENTKDFPPVTHPFRYQGDRVAYLDWCQDVCSIHPGGEQKLLLVLPDIACPQCGKVGKYSANKFSCGVCNGAKSCLHCAKVLVDGHVYANTRVDGALRPLCRGCYAINYCECHQCGEHVPKNTVQSLEHSERTLCQTCFPHFIECAWCYNTLHKTNHKTFENKPICQRCIPRVMPFTCSV